MGGYVSFSSGEQVQVGDLILPGIVTSLEVTGGLEIDEQDLENTNLKALAVLGYTTQVVTLGVTLAAATASELNEQLGRIQSAFQIDRVKGAGAKLIPVRIVNPHLDARRVKKVVFDSFTSRDSNDLEVTCQLRFREYESDVARLQKRVEQEQKRRTQSASNAMGGGSGTGSGGAGKQGKGDAGSGGSNVEAGAGLRAGNSGGPSGTPTPPVGGGSGGSNSGAGGAGSNSVLRGIAAGSAAARALAGR